MYTTITDLMDFALSRHAKSYYRNCHTLGVDGDFITAPEVSQLFGEIIGLWCIECWYFLHCPTKVNLVELGPGSGALLRDALNTIKLVPEFYNSLSIELLEINDHFKNQQAINCNHPQIRWIDNISQISKIPSIFIANEFFDTQSVAQYLKVQDTWYEVVVMQDRHSLQFDKIVINAELQSFLHTSHPNASDKAIVEYSQSTIDIINSIAKHSKLYKSAGIIIDYGYSIDPQLRNASEYVSTLQAIKNHQYVNILDHLGISDLSCHVDFFAIQQAFNKGHIHTKPLISQKDFLIQYGILLRAEMLKRTSAQYKDIIDNQLKRLLSHKQMGNLFKVCQFYSIIS